MGRWLRISVSFVVLCALFSAGLIAGPASAKARAAESNFGTLASSTMPSLGFDAESAVKMREKRIGSQQANGRLSTKSLFEKLTWEEVAEKASENNVRRRNNDVNAQAVSPTNLRPSGNGWGNETGAYWGVEWDITGDTSSCGSATEISTQVRLFDAQTDEMVGDSGEGGGALLEWFTFVNTWPDAFYYADIEVGELYYAAVRLRCNGVASAWVESEPWEARSALQGVPDGLTIGPCKCGDSLGILYQFLTLVGDPVNTATGAFSMSETDAAVTAPGVSLGLRRTYDSADSAAGLLGKGWSFPYGASLEIDEEVVTYTSEHGARAEFIPQDDGSFQGPDVVSSELVTTASGFELRKRDHEVLSFNANGRLTSWKDGSGQGLEFGYADGVLASITDAAGREATVTTNNGGRVTSVALADGRSVAYGYTGGLLTSVTDLRGNTTEYGYDDHDRLVTVTDAKGRVTTENTYDAQGRVVEQTDATGATETYGYEVDGPNTTTTRTDARGGLWTWNYSGNVLLSEIDPVGNITEYEYDNRMQRTAVIDPRGNRTEFDYNARGDMTSRTRGWTETWTYVEGTSDVATHTNVAGVRTSYEYNDAHLPTRITEQRNGESRSRTLSYNARGLLTAQTTWAGHETTYGYDDAGNRTSETSPEGNTTRWTYDASGRVASETDPRGTGDGGGEGFTTRFAYDDGDNLIEQTDARGNTTSWAYDNVGDLVTETNPAGHETSYTYDAAGRQTSMQRDGWEQPARITYQDGADGQPIAETDPTGAMTAYGYDAVGRRTSMVTARGNVEGADPAEFTWSYAFDPNGNLIEETDPLVNTTTTTYDNLNRPRRVTDPAGNTTVTAYNRLDQI